MGWGCTLITLEKRNEDEWIWNRSSRSTLQTSAFQHIPESKFPNCLGVLWAWKILQLFGSLVSDIVMLWICSLSPNALSVVFACRKAASTKLAWTMRISQNSEQNARISRGLAEAMETWTLWRGSEFDKAQLIWDGRRGESRGRNICSSGMHQICLRSGIAITAATIAGAFRARRVSLHRTWSVQSCP